MCKNVVMVSGFQFSVSLTYLLPFNFELFQNVPSVFLKNKIKDIGQVR